MNKAKFLYWLAVQENSLVRFADLAHLMAKAMNPDEDDLMSYGAARINLDDELMLAVRNGTLLVRNPAGMGTHTFPVGAALTGAVLLPADLRQLLEERGIELRLIPHGSGPILWTIENATAAIADQEGWSDYQRAIFQDQMLDAATNRNLTVRHPHIDLPKNAGVVRTSYELVTPGDVNDWLEKESALYRWNAKATDLVELSQNDVLKVANQNIPGKMPHTAMGLTAIEAAWELEQSSGSRSSAKEVMSLLMQWAKAGSKPDVLKSAGTDSRSVEWVTGKGKKKNYGIEALGKSLDGWWKSRD